MTPHIQQQLNASELATANQEELGSVAGKC
jgi:hypothetical protein